MSALVGYGLIALLLALLAMDLGAFGERARAHDPAEAAVWTCIWLSLGFGFDFVVYSLYEYNWQGDELALTRHLTGKEAAIRYFAAFFGQKLFCVGAVIMFALVFSHFRLHLSAQRRALFWGVFGFLVLRALFATAGIGLVRNQEWVVYLFGGGAMYSAAALLAARHDNRRPQRNPLVRIARRAFPTLPDLRTPDFLKRRRGRLNMTQACVALLMTQTVALGFSIGSVPAVTLYTEQPFLIAASTGSACLGLRSLYFLVAGGLQRLRFLKLSLGLVVAFVGASFLAHPYLHVPRWLTILVMLALPAAGGIAAWRHHDAAPLLSPFADDFEEFGKVSVKQTRRIVILTMGVSLVALGLVFLLTPMPGMLTIFAGMGVLSVEFVWARRWLKLLRERAEQVRNSLFNSDKPQ